MATAELCTDDVVEAGDFDGPARPCVPTVALPWSREKVAALAARYAGNQSLFHPDDAKLPPDMCWLYEESGNGARTPRVLVQFFEDGSWEEVSDKPTCKRRKRTAAEIAAACVRTHQEKERKRQERKRRKQG